MYNPVLTDSLVMAQQAMSKKMRALYSMIRDNGKPQPIGATRQHLVLCCTTDGNAEGVWTWKWPLTVDDVWMNAELQYAVELCARVEAVVI